MKVVKIENTSFELSAERIGRERKGNSIILFRWSTQYTFVEILDSIGQIPIPPYLNRDSEEIDLNRYQTVYSKHNGSVAAPTAGLHFTKTVFLDFSKRNIDTAEVTLHVGAGTFQPVKAENALEHAMHGEQFIVTKTFLKQLLAHKNYIIATGTTTLRTLESIYWLGIKACGNENIEKLEQWYWKTNKTTLSLENSLNVLIMYLEKKNSDFLISTTEIMIVPGYDFKVVEGIITNFHQPKSTLLLLIAAFIGKRWKEVYKYALNNDFRFLSYGDSSLLWKH